MNQKQYQALSRWAHKTPLRQKIIASTCRTIPCLIVLLYGMASLCLLSYFLFRGFCPALLSFWIVPAIGFIFTTLIRKKINAPRPNECFQFVPVLLHKTGCSFPSRHTASAFLITCALFYLSFLDLFPFSLSILVLILSVLTGISRIIAGVHFPKDIIAGFLFALLISAAGFYITTLFPFSC